MRTKMIISLRLLFSIVVILNFSTASAQLLSVTPEFPLDNSSVTITVDTRKGNQGLLNYTPETDVYVHLGVITNLSTSSSDWKYVKFTQNFNQPNPALQATYLGDNKYSFTIPDIRNYFGVPAGEKIDKIAILFRSGNGSRKQANSNGSDMFIQIYEAGRHASKFKQPAFQPQFVAIPEPINKSIGDTLPVEYLSRSHSKLSIYYNGKLIKSQSVTTSIAASIVIDSSGNQQVIARADTTAFSKADTINFYVTPPVTTQPLPAGVKDGINYLPGDTSVILVLFAPGKNSVFVIGDFNNWNQSASYQMKKTPDGKYFWLQVNALTPGSEYAYQYLVDANLRIADYYTEKVLDPANDPFINQTTYPNLKPYPTGKTTGLVGVLQTRKPMYNWKVNNFSRPDKRNLMIYELLIRDFVATHDFKTVRDSLNYLKNLGVNAIELMPFNEFEGNISWGYNSSFYFAPDKYYGPQHSLKELIDSCHSKGIAVIMDIVLNHSFGQSPMVQLYWDAANNRPAANNPWFNAVTPHAFGFGYDFNLESDATKYFVDRVLSFWLTEYKVDGFRFDFTKGFTQKASSNDGQFSAYDQSRVDILNRINNTVKSNSADAYVILEHLADNSEEKVLAAQGMMLWGNLNHTFNEATMGWLPNSNFEWALHTKREFPQPLLISYMESHDEERLMFKNIKYGNETPSYKIKADTLTSLKRNELATAFYLTIPGPKMIWQFGELGYDYSRCYLSTNGEGGECDRKLDVKPIRWDYFKQQARKQLYDVHAKLMKLRTEYAAVFTTGTVSSNLAGASKILQITHTDLSVTVIGNFDVNPATASFTFQNAGSWYNLFTGEMITATGTAQTVALAPGEYRYYVNKNVGGTTPTGIRDVLQNNLLFKMKVYPSPGKANNIQFELPEKGQVVMELINLTGQPVSTLSLGMKPKGSYTISLNNFKTSAALKPGVYFIRLSLDRKSGYTKFILR